MSAPPPEVEAKLLVADPADLGRIARLDRLGPWTLRRRGSVRLRTLYLDTANLVLARNGLALRLRRAGRRWELTLKWGGEVRGAVHERPELTVTVARPPELPWRVSGDPFGWRLKAWLADRPVDVSVVTEVQRRLLDILPPGATPDAEPAAELALDRVRVAPRPAAAPVLEYCEAEIEARAGGRRAVTATARILQRLFGLSPAADTKYARGLVAVHGPGALSRDPPALAAHDTLEQAARKVVARHLRRLRQCDPGTREGADPEALHDMRVAVRRLRAAVRAFADGIPAATRSRMTEELRWLGQALGRVRDVDVQLENVRTFAAGAPPGHRGGLQPYVEYLEREREARRAVMLAELDSQRYCRLVLLLEGFAEGPARSRSPGAREPVASAGRRALKKAFRRLLKRGAKVQAGAPAPEDLHALRIRAKRVRYLLEFLRDLTGKPGRRLVRQLTRLQDLLGAYHDAVVAAEFVRAFVEGPGKDAGPATLLALGALVGSDLRIAEHSRLDFERTWRRFARRRNLETLETVLATLAEAASAAGPEGRRAGVRVTAGAGG